MPSLNFEQSVGNDNEGGFGTDGPYFEQRGEEGEEALIERLKRIRQQQGQREADTGDMIERINKKLIEKLSDLIAREAMSTGDFTDKIEMIETAFADDISRLQDEYSKLREESDNAAETTVIQKRLANLS